MVVFRNTITLIIFLFFSAISVAQSDVRPEVAKKVIAYHGQQGVMVWTLRIGAPEEKEALVQIEGIDHAWDLKIQKMKVEKTSRDTRYYTENKGKKFVALIIKDRCCGEVYLPDEPQPIMVSYSDALSHEGNAQAFLTDYLQNK